ncbi:MAG TPA: TetR/AcrR family transcriptional regulator [Candidatus Acidoferrales bacterium]|jgi:TetR/AcrR family transcriptional regulator of autoinduction and epiphytic fitness|nr:TetR/AcrR family transcriptional regulator [Candidatus Acidoferrales bacterium]
MSPARTPPTGSSRDRLREAAKILFAERGYETTSTAAIARLAGTSQSQLIKHFTNKEGLLEAIFDHAWQQINPAIQMATQAIDDPKEKLRVLLEMVMNFMEKDRAQRALFLLEGRRIRGSSHVVAFVPGFREFIRTLDGILSAMSENGELAPGVHPQALRSALMGTLESLLRDQLLAKTSKFPASYSDEDIRAVFTRMMNSCLAEGG